MAYSHSDLFKQLGLDKHIQEVDKVAAELKTLKMEHNKGQNMDVSKSTKKSKDDMDER